MIDSQAPIPAAQEERVAHEVTESLFQAICLLTPGRLVGEDGSSSLPHDLTTISAT